VKRTVPSPLRGILARNLRAIRARIGWSQERLAAAAELNRTYVSAVERGEQNISIDNIYKLSRALGIDAQHLLDQEAKIVASVNEPKGTGRRSV
jgi:transcriptional regulator with XRE-family HTH domain